MAAASQLPTGIHASRCPGRAMSLEGSTPSPSADNDVLLAERQRLQASNLAEVGFDSRRALFPWVGSSAAEQVPVEQRCGFESRPSLCETMRGSRCW